MIVVTGRISDRSLNCFLRRCLFAQFFVDDPPQG